MNSGATDPMQNAYFAAFYMSLDALGTLFVALCFGANFGRRILLMALLFVVGALTFSLGRLQNADHACCAACCKSHVPSHRSTVHIYT